jgi:hypothetical protein
MSRRKRDDKVGFFKHKPGVKRTISRQTSRQIGCIYQVQKYASDSLRPRRFLTLTVVEVTFRIKNYNFSLFYKARDV